jgi:hypothetical protein
MDATKVRILAMDVVRESDLPKQEKLELLDFVMETEDLSVVEGVLDSYGLIEQYEEDEDENEEASESAMGPLKTPRDEDLDKIQEIEIPSVLEKKGMSRAVASFFKREVIPARKKIQNKLPQYSTHIPVKLPSGGIINIRRNTAVP